MPELRMQAPVGDGCLICGGTPLSEDGENKVLPMVVHVGADVNWGDPVQFCQDCVGVMADLMGRVDKEDHDRVVFKSGELAENHNQLIEKYEAMSERLNKILAGKKAEKQQKEAE